MEFVQQLRAHRQKASEQWARDRFFTATSDRRTSTVSLPTRFALFLRKWLNLHALFVLLITEVILRFILATPLPAWVEVPLVFLAILIFFRLVIPRKRVKNEIELIDHRRILGKAVVSSSPEKEV